MHFKERVEYKGKWLKHIGLCVCVCVCIVAATHVWHTLLYFHVDVWVHAATWSSVVLMTMTCVCASIQRTGGRSHQPHVLMCFCLRCIAPGDCRGVRPREKSTIRQRQTLALGVQPASPCCASCPDASFVSNGALRWAENGLAHNERGHKSTGGILIAWS